VISWVSTPKKYYNKEVIIMADAEKAKITVREFRCWLQGVEEMQEDGWTPSATQWAKIREKIDNIADSPTKPAQQEAPPVRYATPSGVPPQQPQGPVTLAAPPSLPPPRSAAPNPLLATGGNTPIKTPDIDTSGKGYESNFV
jgi:hypothetical protein